jgi:hypothetical protein
LTVQHEQALLDTSVDTRGDFSASSQSFPLLVNSDSHLEEDLNGPQPSKNNTANQPPGQLVFTETVSLSAGSLSSLNDDERDNVNEQEDDDEEENNNNSQYVKLKMSHELSGANALDSQKVDSCKNEKLKLQSIIEAVGFILFPSAGFMNLALKDLLVEHGLFENFQ